MSLAHNACVPVALLALMAACASTSTSVTTDPSVASLPAEIRETSTGVLIRVTAEQLVVNTEVDVSRERAWELVPRVYAALGIPGQVLNSTELKYGNQGMTQSRIGGRRLDDYVRCAFQGAGPSAAGGYRTRLAVTTRVEPASTGHSILSTQITASATSVEGTSTEAVRCVSNGDLERLIASTLTDLAVAR